MPGYLLLIEVILLAMLSPELGAIPSYQSTSDEIEVVGNLHCLHKDFPDRIGIIPSEIGNGVVVWL